MTFTSDQDDPIIVWIGRFFADDGYGTAARLHLGALREIGAPVVGVDIKSRALVGSVSDRLIETGGSDRSLTIRALDPNRKITTIVHDRPDSYPQVRATGRSRLIGYTYWETTSLPPDWATWMQSMDRVWTSSYFNASAFADAGVPAWMIDIVGHPVDQLVRDVASSREELRVRWPETTVFLSIVSSAVGRRDLNLLFEAYAMAFQGADDVALVLKVPESAVENVSSTLERAMLSMPARSSGRWPTVYTVPANLTREQLMRLHGSVDCYVSCERGNGWDLPAFDSMAMGVPVVAADFGASTMFVDPVDSYVVRAGTKLVACDAAFHGRHPLYSGQYWPYVDPAALAAELRRAHDSPAERQKRGVAAAQRINHDFDPSSVASEVLALASSTRHIDYRAGNAAQVTISEKADMWPRFNGAPTVAGHQRLQEAALAGLLRHPDFLHPRDPRAFWRAYKRATAFAEAHRKVLAGTSLREGLAQSMATSARHPVRKLRAISSLRRRVSRETSRLGDPEDLRELPAFVQDYQAAVKGDPSRLSPTQLEALWRSVDVSFGWIRSPDADLDRLKALHNRHQGRVFILGNGPSLLNCDLDRLAGEYTFAVNKIHLLLDQIEWRPSFYTLLDRKMGAAVRDEIRQLDGSLKFVPERFRGVIPASPDTYWYWTRPFGVHIDDQFERDITRGIPSRASVLVTAIQQAFYLGFRELILIGVDAEYTIPDTVRQSGPDQFGTGTRLHLTSTADDDPNHFSPKYFGKGAEWHDPNVDDMHRMFRLMRKGVERHGGRLLNATVGGSLEVLERVDYDDFFR